MSWMSAASAAEWAALGTAKEAPSGHGALRRLPVRATLVRMEGFQDGEMEPVIRQMNVLMERLAAAGKTVETTQFGCGQAGLEDGSGPVYWGIVRWVEQEPEAGR